MKCIYCGNDMARKSGVYAGKVSFIGEVTIPNAEWDECEQCHERLFPAVLCQQLDTASAEKKRHLLRTGFVVDDYISVAETIQILGVTRQALHKNTRIYWIENCGNRLYLRRSVEQYKATKDGRFNLDPASLVDESKYRGRYVALRSFTDSNVVASGKDVGRVFRSATRKGVSKPVVFFVAPKEAVCA